jgi:hypothetical protein
VSTAGLVLAAASFVVVIVVWTYACCWRLPRTGVLVYADGVVVRNPLRQRAVPWGEIDRFAVESAGYQRGVMYLRNGERIELSGVQGQLQALFPRSEWASKPIGELNALLAKSRR